MTAREIMRLVASFYGLRNEELLGAGRTKCYALPRQVAMYLIRVELGYSLHQTAREFGRDHTTVLCAERRVKEMIATQPEIVTSLARIREQMTAPKKKETCCTGCGRSFGHLRGKAFRLGLLSDELRVMRERLELLERGKAA